MQLFFLFLCAFLALTASAAPYIVTSYVVISVETFTYYGSTELYTETSVVAKPTASVSVLSTLTESAAYADVTVVYEVLQSGQPTSRTYNTGTDEVLYTSYVVPITYSADATCSQDWTYSTNVPVSLPAVIKPTPVTATTSTTTHPYGYGYSKPQETFVVAVLNASDVDAAEVASASSAYAPSYISYCYYTPTTTCSTPTGTAAQCTTTFVYDSSSSNRGSFYEDPYYTGYWWTPLILICVLVPVGWFLLWLIIGLFESWMSFKGLMLGQHRKRGLPYAWCCISIIFLCWTGPTYKAKSPEEQAVMLERWKAMKAGEKFKLWMKWGFRWKYPTMLGEEPEIAKRALRQGCL
ncbi:hypothetical protein ONS95_009496 [Cadophora gregata]|uniref:uncharacterized protein n=1 Tax=Cadophora gregata TaxID=51156 RepID=UPI0026DC5096|nr:uncharacterized protein ONS95_009496 [Cadophora gregata]KAK0124548.1 hypothetical protein ONS95_009496 [Cadophora gregata]KAK0129599.1 hypothetical protein ONS96_000165 [Cadophora gregata f. sp. sojae]